MSANAGTPPPSASLSGDRPRRRKRPPFDRCDRVPPVSLSGKPWRPSASRHHRQTVRPVSDSGGQGFRNRSTVGRVPLPMIPATVCRAGFAAPVSGSEVATIGTPRRIRHHRTRQPLAGSSPRLSAGNRSTVCRLSAIPATVRRHLRTRASRGNRSTVANIERRRNAAQPFDRAGSVRQSRASRKPSAPDSPPSNAAPPFASDDSGGQGFRQAVRPVSGSEVPATVRNR